MGSVISPVKFTVAFIGSAGPGEFGSGFHGTAVFDGSTAVTGCTRSGSVYTAQEELFFTSATFSTGVTLDMTLGGTIGGFRFYSQAVSVISGTATIKFDGNSASNNVGGAALGNSPIGMGSGSGASGIQNAGQAGSNVSQWANRFRGGNGGAGGSSPTNVSGPGGTATTIGTDSIGAPLTWDQLRIGKIGLNTSFIIQGGAGGGSGAGTVGVASGGGGGGGAGGGVIGIRTLTGAGNLQVTAIGGTGGNGVSGTGSNAAGGGGGGGGWLAIGYGGTSTPGNLITSVLGGNGGINQGTGNPGAAGGAGTAIVFILGPS